MKLEKKIRIALITNAVLLITLVLGLVFAPGKVSIRKNTRTLLSKDEVAAIEIAYASPIRIQKDGSNWIIVRDEKTYPADGKRIEKFLELLQKPVQFTPVGKTKEAASTYLLDEEHRIEVRVTQASNVKPVKFFVSPMYETADACYMMLSGGVNVYKAQTALASYFYGKPTDWFDLRFFQGVSARDVESFTVNGFYKAFTVQGTFTRKVNGWEYNSSQQPVASQAVESWLQDIVSGKGSDYIDVEEAKHAKELVLITLELGNGTTKQLRIYQSTSEDRFICFASDRLDPILCTESTIETLLRKPESLQ